MLELRPTCENCNTALPPDSAEARICSFECTFCARCVEEVLGNVCPNCGGGFAPRPIRPVRDWKGENHLGKYPASAKRNANRGSAAHAQLRARGEITPGAEPRVATQFAAFGRRSLGSMRIAVVGGTVSSVATATALRRAGHGGVPARSLGTDVVTGRD